VNEEADVVQLQVAGALGNQYRQEQREFLGYLANLLKTSMPNSVTLQSTGIFKKSLVGLKIEVGGDILGLSVLPNQELQPTFTKVVRGIALKTETLQMEEWIALLSEWIGQNAKSSETSRNALAQLLALP
jgi:hypothetical protein